MERLRIKLDSIAKMHDESIQCENDIVTAILDAWSLIDVCHRIRRLIFQISGLPHNTAALQIFSRATRQVETLRHYVQHFASGIQSIPRNSYPLWGALSWVPSFAPCKCYTIVTGNLLPGINAPSCAYDTHKLQFDQRLMLYASGTSINLQDIADNVGQLRTFFADWLRRDPRFNIIERHIPIMTFEVHPDYPDRKSS